MSYLRYTVVVRPEQRGQCLTVCQHTTSIAMLESRYLTTVSSLPRQVATCVGRLDTVVKYLDCNKLIHIIEEPSQAICSLYYEILLEDSSMSMCLSSGAEHLSITTFVHRLTGNNTRSQAKCMGSGQFMNHATVHEAITEALTASHWLVIHARAIPARHRRTAQQPQAKNRLGAWPHTAAAHEHSCRLWLCTATSHCHAPPQPVAANECRP